MSEEPNPNAFADIAKLLREEETPETPTPEPEKIPEKKEKEAKVEKPALVATPIKKASKPVKPRQPKPEGQLVVFPKEFSEITTRLETGLGEIKNLLVKKTEEKNLTTYEIEEIQTRGLTPLEKLLKDYFESANIQLKQILENLPKEKILEENQDTKIQLADIQVQLKKNETVQEEVRKQIEFLSGKILEHQPISIEKIPAQIKESPIFPDEGENGYIKARILQYYAIHFEKRGKWLARQPNEFADILETTFNENYNRLIFNPLLSALKTDGYLDIIPPTPKEKRPHRRYLITEKGLEKINRQDLNPQLKEEWEKLKQESPLSEKSMESIIPEQKVSKKSRKTKR
jgi:hypothetical protein